MKNILSPCGINKLKTISKENTIYCFDFDGTLAPIVNNPMDARLNQTTKKHLMGINSKRPTAIISGRSIVDLKYLLGCEVDFLIGNHGLEGSIVNNEFLKDCQEISQAWLHRLQELINHSQLNEEIKLEDKIYSLCLHYPHSFDQRLHEKLKQILHKLTPVPKILTGKLVINLLPTAHINKGTALIDLMKVNKFTHAFYIGDDVTDEDVFKIRNIFEISSYRNYPLSNENLLTVQIGRNMRSHAEFYLEEQSDIDILLNEIMKSNSSFC